VAWARLAVRAEVTAAAAHDDATDVVSAATARLAGALIHLELGLEIPRAPFNIDVVPEAGALQGHGPRQNLLYRSIQTPRSSLRHSPRLGQRVNSGFEKRLVSIDVPEPGQHFLIQQPGLDSSPSPPHRLEELVRGNLWSVRPQARKHLVKLLARAATQPTEASRVPVANLLSASFEEHPHVGVRFEGRFLRCHRELTGHAQTDQQVSGCRSIPGNELQSQNLALTRHRLDAPSRDGLNELISRVHNHPWIVDLDGHQTTPQSTF
jgi:hypothetical protein